MKTKLAFLILIATFATTAHASKTILPDACGDEKVQFDIQTKKDQPAPAAPEEGKAQIIFIETFRQIGHLGTPEARFGMDGAWVGAFKHNSYFSVSVNPGEYHACANLQSVTALGKVVAFAQVTAEAGKVYYLGTRARIIGGTTRLEIEPIDVDQAKYLITSSPLSVSQPKE